MALYMLKPASVLVRLTVSQTVTLPEGPMVLYMLKPTSVLVRLTVSQTVTLPEGQVSKHGA